MLLTRTDWVQRILASARKIEAPAPAPASKGKPQPGTQEWFRALATRPKDDPGINMNDLLRSVPSPRMQKKPRWGF